LDVRASHPVTGNREVLFGERRFGNARNPNRGECIEGALPDPDELPPELLR
jgi:hypothetical protein